MANKPNIRFKGFTEDWEQRKLGELSSSFEYGLNASAKEYDGENKYIRITDIDDDSREFKQKDITSPDTDLSSAENYKLSEGDILFARTGASVGKSYIYKASDGLVYYAGFLIRARIKPEYNSEFVFQNTLTGDYEKFIKVTSMRSGQPGVNAQEYSQYQIMVPSKPEQDKISDCLRNLDNLITLHQRKCDDTKKLKKYMLQKMFPKNGEKKPEIRFAGFTDDWEQRKLSDIVDSVDTGKSKFDKEGSSGEYPILGSTSVIGYDDEYDYEGDFILTARVGANAGNLYRHAGKVKISDNTVFIQTSQNIEFLYQLLMQYDVKKLSFGTGQPLVKASELKSLELMMPTDKKEQMRIGTYLKNLDNLITLHQRKCDDLKNLKKYMLQNMFV